MERAPWLTNIVLIDVRRTNQHLLSGAQFAAAADELGCQEASTERKRPYWLAPRSDHERISALARDALDASTSGLTDRTLVVLPLFPRLRSNSSIKMAPLGTLALAVSARLPRSTRACSALSEHRRLARIRIRKSSSCPCIKRAIQASSLAATSSQAMDSEQVKTRSAQIALRPDRLPASASARCEPRRLSAQRNSDSQTPVALKPASRVDGIASAHNPLNGSQRRPDLAPLRNRRTRPAFNQPMRSKAVPASLLRTGPQAFTAPRRMHHQRSRLSARCSVTSSAPEKRPESEPPEATTP